MDDTEINLNNILNRKSVRNFTDEKVDKNDLLKIIKAGMSAPSALNLQPWEFLIFDNHEIIEWMVDLHDYSKMFKTATAGIVVCGNMEKTIEGVEEFWIQDCSAATENILLAIESLNLGGVWLGIYPIENRYQKISNYFKLPENIIPFAVIALGHPSNNEKSKDKWDDKKLHWNKW